jgi:release factor glutamine methyltransferase
MNGAASAAGTNLPAKQVNGTTQNGNGRYEIVWSLDRSSDVGRALLAAVRRLREADVESAQLDAAVLLAYVLGVNKTWVYAHPTRQLTEPEISRYEALVRRRMRHEPVAYLIGYKSFYGLDITVDKRVLIPRPETEILVERALAEVQWRSQEAQTPVVADVGTGSGAIAIAVACNARDATVYAVDISDDALAVAEQNIWRYGLAEQVHLLPGHLLEVLPEPADVILANLPYVATDALAKLPPQIRDYEPVLALDGGPDGLRVIAKLLAQLATPEGGSKLKPGGRMYLEIGSDQGEGMHSLVRELLLEAHVEIQVDYAALDRVAMISF